MAVQQCKVSKQNIRSRRSANRFKGLESGTCPNCDGTRLPHRVCSHCGYYNGRQVLTVAGE